MSILEAFKRNVAILFGIDPSNIDVSADGLTIAGTFLGVPGTFDLLTLLESATIVEVQVDQVKIRTASREMVLSRAQVRPQQEFGVLELGTADTWLFLGSFGTVGGPISLDLCPELLLAIGCFDPVSITAPNRDWCSIVESWGAMVATLGNPCRPGLAEIGCFLQPSAPKSPDYELPSKARPFVPKTSVPPEALTAYVGAFQTTDGPDVAFLRFYRIFELEFTSTIQDQIRVAPLSKVYEMVRMLHNSSEFEILKRTIERTTCSFSQFAVGDFEALFGIGYKPNREHYRKISKWLEATPPQNVPDDCRAQVIYYVRCALVHSKLTETEQFLFGPFEGARAEALSRLVNDMRSVLRTLLAV